MGKTREFFKKIRDTKGTLHAKMGSIKDMGLTEAEDVKEEVARIHRRTVQKILHDPDNHNGVISHLEPDILQSEVKWA